MKPLTQTSAKYFVSAFSANAAVRGQSVSDYLGTLPSGSVTFVEGTPRFSLFKDCLLRESEQALLLSGNCYARALDGLREGSAYWSMVGFYYSAFLSIKAVLGMYGCWMGQPKKWIEVVDSNPGTQKFQYKTALYPNHGGKSGSHKITWMAYYEAMNHLSAWLTSSHAVLATTPVNSNKTWMIDARNDVNYDPQAAFEVMANFQRDFSAANVPNCFGGKLQTMYRVAEAFVLFSKEAALGLGLKTDVCHPAPSRLDWCKQYVTADQHAALRAFAKTEFGKIEF